MKAAIRFQISVTSLATGIIGVAGESKGALASLSNGTNSPYWEHWVVSGPEITPART